jgi:hypothetical protein
MQETSVKQVPNTTNAGYLLDLFVDPEDVGDMFLRNVDFQRTARRYVPEDRTAARTSDPTPTL